MKRILAVMLTALALCAETGAEGKLSYTFSETVSSKYHGNIVGGIFYPHPLAYTELNIARADKYGATYIDFWAARPITNRQYNVSGGDEYDFTLGRSLAFAKTDKGPAVVLDLSGTYLAVHPLASFNGHVYTLQGRVDLPRVPFVQPYLTYYHFGQVGRMSPPAGEFVYMGAIRNQATSLMIAGRAVTLGFDYRFGLAGTALGSDAGPAYNRLTASVNLPIGRRTTLTPTVIGQVPFKRDDPLKVLGDHSRAFFTLTLTHRWGKQ